MWPLQLREPSKRGENTPSVTVVAAAPPMGIVSQPAGLLLPALRFIMEGESALLLEHVALSEELRETFLFQQILFTLQAFFPAGAW